MTIVAGDYVKLRGNKAEGWAWTVHSRNGRKIATCGEFYHSRGYTVRMMRRLFPTHSLRDENNNPLGV